MAIQRSELLKLARAGAAAKVQELREEIDAIYRSFPDLRRGEGRRGKVAHAGDNPRPGRRKWTAAQRKAAAERMRKYWAARRNKK
jgi:hypothetical protein